MLRACLLTCCVSSVLVAADRSPAAEGFSLRDGDKVVLLGGALIEQEQLYGYWETLLTAASQGRDVRFRNLGWSGDTVWGESRGMFEPHEGYDRLIEHVRQEQPTVVVVAYGNSEAFDGEERLEAFASQLRKLVADLSADGRRFVFVSPLLMEASQLPLEADAAERYAQSYNQNVVRYSDVIRQVAGENKAPYLDLQAAQLAAIESDGPPLTDNGLRVTEDGYRQSARWLASRLRPAGDVDQLESVVDLDFDAPAARALRDAIRAKNQLYFHRWRPQNFTYLFGFRKHEQGNNAVEIPQFDPLVEEAEAEIGRLKRALN